MCPEYTSSNVTNHSNLKAVSNEIKNIFSYGSNVNTIRCFVVSQQNEESDWRSEDCLHILDLSKMNMSLNIWFSDTGYSNAWCEDTWLSQVHVSACYGSGMPIPCIWGGF